MSIPDGAAGPKANTCAMFEIEAPVSHPNADHPRVVRSGPAGTIWSSGPNRVTNAPAGAEGRIPGIPVREAMGQVRLPTMRQPRFPGCGAARLTRE